MAVLSIADGAGYKNGDRFVEAGNIGDWAMSGRWGERRVMVGSARGRGGARSIIVEAVVLLQAVDKSRLVGILAVEQPVAEVHCRWNYAAFSEPHVRCLKIQTPGENALALFPHAGPPTPSISPPHLGPLLRLWAPTRNCCPAAPCAL